VYLNGGHGVADQHDDNGRNYKHEGEDGHSLGLSRIRFFQNFVNAGPEKSMFPRLDSNLFH